MKVMNEGNEYVCLFVYICLVVTYVQRSTDVRTEKKIFYQDTNIQTV